MKHTHLICLFLALLMTVSLAACGNTTTETTDSVDTNDTTPVETEPLDPIDRLEIKDYEGYNFRMLIRNSPEWLGDMVAEDMTGEVVNDAVYRRNMETAERYNIVLSHTPSSNNNSETDAKPLILAGEDAYDLVVPHPRVAHLYANEGLTLDWNSIAYLDLEQPWWDQDARESFQMPSGLYCMVGDLSHQSVGMCNAILFNKDFFDENGLEYPYQLVKDGGWTVDVFTEMAETYARDLDGDGKYSSKDLYGYATFVWTGPVQAFYSSGARVISKTSDSYEFNVFNERSVAMFEKYFALLEASHSYMDTTATSSETIRSLKLFREGHALFIDANVFMVLSMREMEYDFGILPWPKLEESDTEYWSNVDAGTNMFTIPITNADPDRTGHILETLAILGREYVIPSYYEVALKTRDSRDMESAEMLDIIVQNRVFDLGYYNDALGGAYSGHFASLAMARSDDFASWYESKLEAAEKSRDDTLAIYQNRLNQ